MRLIQKAITNIEKNDESVENSNSKPYTYIGFSSSGKEVFFVNQFVQYSAKVFSIKNSFYCNNNINFEYKEKLLI